eukprot:TRINITY_DN15344_c0_g1_i1.p1 TRINITY_DN15344_c0_g1~~TRINITY_DN15344_c0_g1_i1.p1  ORF type:complete len:101 (+),score=32.05 TRINITY_DN15344_c0_g1_i1:103-405(+)
MQRGLVGSEMCIRDSCYRLRRLLDRAGGKFNSIIRNCSSVAVLPMYSALIPVSYTHLTLPTILLVQISVVAVSLKKKKRIKTQVWRTENEQNPIINKQHE